MLIGKLWDIAKQRAIRSANVVFIKQENAMTEDYHVGELGERQNSQQPLLVPSIEQAPHAKESIEQAPHAKESIEQAIEQAPHASKSIGQAPRKNSGEANRPNALNDSHDELLRQVEGELQALTSTEAHHAFHAHVQNHLDGLENVHDPITFNEAMASPWRNEWIAAMREELNSLHLNNTWEIAAPGQNHGIGSKWVFKTKLNPDDTTRFKARSVIKGYRQIKVGSLMYAALGGKPDISYAVNLLSRYNIDPRTRHLSVAKRLLRYLKSDILTGLEG